jgi:hypothetical protein
MAQTVPPSPRSTVLLPGPPVTPVDPGEVGSWLATLPTSAARAAARVGPLPKSHRLSGGQRRAANTWRGPDSHRGSPLSQPGTAPRCGQTVAGLTPCRPTTRGRTGNAVSTRPAWSAHGGDRWLPIAAKGGIAPGPADRGAGHRFEPAGPPRLAARSHPVDHRACRRHFQRVRPSGAVSRAHPDGVELGAGLGPQRPPRADHRCQSALPAPAA